MSALWFLPQSAVEGWTARGVVDVTAGVLTVQSGASSGQRLALQPAVRFVAVADGAMDPNGLVGRVKVHGDLKALGAEVLGDSVLLGEVAYDVQQGYAAVAQGVTPEAPPDAPAVSPKEKARNDAADLARFLLSRRP